MVKRSFVILLFAISFQICFAQTDSSVFVYRERGEKAQLLVFKYYYPVNGFSTTGIKNIYLQTEGDTLKAKMYYNSSLSKMTNLLTGQIYSVSDLGMIAILTDYAGKEMTFRPEIIFKNGSTEIITGCPPVVNEIYYKDSTLEYPVRLNPYSSESEYYNYECKDYSSECECTNLMIKGKPDRYYLKIIFEYGKAYFVSNKGESIILQLAN
jgi:hypothetical protein